MEELCLFNLPLRVFLAISSSALVMFLSSDSSLAATSKISLACDADPEIFNPKSPLSLKLELMVCAPSMKTCLLSTLRWILPNLRPFPRISSARSRGRE